jgi:hypothetical protein
MMFYPENLKISSRNPDLTGGFRAILPLLTFPKIPRSRINFTEHQVLNRIGYTILPVGDVSVKDFFSRFVD